MRIRLTIEEVWLENEERLYTISEKRREFINRIRAKSIGSGKCNRLKPAYSFSHNKNRAGNGLLRTFFSRSKSTV